MKPENPGKTKNGYEIGWSNEGMVRVGFTYKSPRGGDGFECLHILVEDFHELYARLVEMEREKAE